MKFKLTIIIIILANILQAQDFVGKVVGITDGDTVKVLKGDKSTVKIRLANIDCPERKQPFSSKAKQFTSEAVFSKIVTIQVLKVDRYGRLVANIIYDDKLNLSEELVKVGLAWHYKRYSKDKYLQYLEDKARITQTGLWSDPNAIPPWEWRRRKFN